MAKYMLQLRGVIGINNLRLYLETTVFNYYFDEDRDGHADTVRLFKAIGAGEFEGYTSIYATDELREAIEPKRSDMLTLIDKYSVITFDIEGEANRLANLYIKNGVIPVKYRIDATHIAIASIHGLDCVISYNFEHINRERTRLLTGRINYDNGYRSVAICTSKEVLDDGR
ncbi:hypothetical protein AGMMS50276_26390 [Synergistales bacterium]|nr:hypothetical protein AGMMS50276_26390 [Synergistales bacterium]